jgi:hypothetical protein
VNTRGFGLEDGIQGAAKKQCDYRASPVSGRQMGHRWEGSDRGRLAGSRGGSSGAPRDLSSDFHKEHAPGMVDFGPPPIGDFCEKASMGTDFHPASPKQVAVPPL